MSSKVKVFNKKLTTIKLKLVSLFTETSNGVEFRDDLSSIVSLVLVTSSFSSMSPSINLSSVFVLTRQRL